MTRQFAAEGALHLYSSPPVPLYPAELYLADSRPDIRQALELCNLYMITCRKRIVVEPESLQIEADWLMGNLLAHTGSGWVRLPFRYQLMSGHYVGDPQSVAINTNAAGTYVCLASGQGHKVLVPAYVIVAQAECELGDASDLDVLYVGIGIGRTRSRLAIDRLVAHSKLQRILAETLSNAPHLEVLVLLYRFEHHQIFVSSGGDMTLELTKTEEEERKHMSNMAGASFDRGQRVGLAEAALINYFQPPYNELFTRTDFAASRKRMRLLRHIEDKGVTGLITEICTSNIKARLRSETQPPTSYAERFRACLDEARVTRLPDSDRQDMAKLLSDMAHTHVVEIPLTTSEERNTFLHGMRWRNEY